MSTRGPSPRPPRLSVTAAALMEQSTGQMLYGLGAQRELAIASTTKLMTALVTLDRVRDLGTVLTQNDYVSSPIDSQIGLRPGDRMTVHDLLIALLLPSADDAAEDLAYNVGSGSVARFVDMMNARAAELGLSHTHYSTPIGLDQAGNYSSASDLVHLAAYLRATEPFFRHVVALPSARLRTGPDPYVSNRNDLVARFSWINGVKTGHTLNAGFVLISSATRNGMTLIGAVLGTDSEISRDANTLALVDWGYAHFHLLTPVKARVILAKPAILYRPGKRAELIAATTFRSVFARRDRITFRVHAPRRLQGPIPRHAAEGWVTVLVDSRPVTRIPLVLAQALPYVAPPTTLTEFLTEPITLAWIAPLALIGVLGAASVRRRRRGAPAGGSRRP